MSNAIPGQGSGLPGGGKSGSGRKVAVVVVGTRSATPPARWCRSLPEWVKYRDATLFVVAPTADLRLPGNTTTFTVV